MNEAMKFEAWVTAMPDELQAFVAFLPNDVAKKLDGSSESLMALEAWLLERYKDFDAIKAEPDTLVIDGAARYLGEVFRENLGGVWDIQLDDPKDANYAVPVVVGYPGQQTPLTPHSLVTACTDRRSGAYFSTIFEYQASLKE